MLPVKKKTIEVSYVETKPFVIKIPSFLIPTQYIKISSCVLLAVLILGILTSFNSKEPSFVLSQVNISQDSLDSNIIVQTTQLLNPTETKSDVKTLVVNSMYKEWVWYLKAREGFIDHSYICPAGYLTVGYGHNIDAHGWERCKKYIRDGKITYEGATKLLQEDIQFHYDQVKKLLPKLSKHQQLAVTSLAMNCGLAKVMYVGGKKEKGFSGFWKSCLNGNVPAFHKYNGYKARGVWKTSPNLIQARKFEYALFTGDINKINTMAEKYRTDIMNRDILPAKQKGLLK